LDVRLLAVASPHPRLLTLSPKELLVLELLLRHQDLYGLQLVATSRGRLKRGTVYVTLARMEEKGYVTSKLDAAPSGMGGLPRRIYAATAPGSPHVRGLDQRRDASGAGVGAMTPPGTRLRALAARLCAARTMERLVDPAIADLQANTKRRRARDRGGEAAGSGCAATSRSS
jgi:hypothetical protein